jgi:predicted O-methyltransferase YrrM
MTFTLDHFTRNIPNFEYVKGILGPQSTNLTYLELGSREGMSLLWCLDNLNIRKAICVDTWANEKWERNFHSNLKQHEQHQRVVVSKKDATKFCIENNVPHTIDLVYIDADHLATSVLVQAALCFRMLKRGGVMIIDDYGWTGGKQNGGKLPPKVGVDCFMTTFIEEYDLLIKNWQVVIKKK